MKTILIVTLVSTINGQSMTDTFKYESMARCKEAEQLVLTQKELMKLVFKNKIEKTECLQVE